MSSGSDLSAAELRRQKILRNSRNRLDLLVGIDFELAWF